MFLKIKMCFKKADARYFCMAAFSFMLIVLISGFGYGFDAPKKSSFDYPIGVFYIFTPFLLLWSIVKLFITYNQPKSVDETHNENLLTNIPVMESLYSHIEVMERKALEQLISSRARAQSFERYGLIALCVAIVLPAWTWFYAWNSAASATEHKYIWPFVFSTTGFGLVATTIAVTLLRHGKAHLSDSNKLEGYVESLKRVKISLCVESIPPIEDVLNILSKFAKHPSSQEAEEVPASNADELKNVFTLISSLASKT